MSAHGLVECPRCGVLFVGPNPGFSTAEFSTERQQSGENTLRDPLTLVFR